MVAGCGGCMWNGMKEGEGIKPKSTDVIHRHRQQCDNNQRKRGEPKVGKEGQIGDICNNVNNTKNKDQKETTCLGRGAFL